MYIASSPQFVGNMAGALKNLIGECEEETMILMVSDIFMDVILLLFLIRSTTVSHTLCFNKTVLVIKI